MVSSCRLNKHGQVWIETVIYTVIGLAIIGILLAVARPKIEAMQDRILIDQAVDSLNKIDGVIFEVQRAPGNKRPNEELKVAKGRFTIDADTDSISWAINSKYQYSEFNKTVSLGDVDILTAGAEGAWTVTMTLRPDVNILIAGSGGKKEVSEAATPYALSIENVGNVGGKIGIEMGIN